MNDIIGEWWTKEDCFGENLAKFFETASLVAATHDYLVDSMVSLVKYKYKKCNIPIKGVVICGAGTDNPKVKAVFK
jgi:hypothetical protein